MAAIQASAVAALGAQETSETVAADWSAAAEFVPVSWVSAEVLLE